MRTFVKIWVVESTILLNWDVTYLW